MLSVEASGPSLPFAVLLTKTYITIETNPNRASNRGRIGIFYNTFLQKKNIYIFFCCENDPPDMFYPTYYARI
jgi:hypothetical protein